MTSRSRASSIRSQARAARRDRRRGRAGITLLFWVFALCLFALPFLGEPTRADAVDWTVEPAGGEWGSIDPGRNLEVDIPFALDVSDFDEEFAGEFEQDLSTVVREASRKFYAPDSELLADSGLIDVSILAAGRRAYESECAGCHGAEGDGGGPSARYLHPRPRNFRKGKFKFTSTGTGERPRREDLHRTITNGLVGSAMPGFPLISEQRRWDIVEYVRYLSIRGEFEQIMIDSAWNEEEIPDAAEIAEIVNARWDSRRLKVVFPSAAEPENDQASIDRGRVLFNDPTRASCFTCHGPDGRGDGPTADEYDDDWGYPIRPRNFHLGVFRVGSEPQNLYMSVATGIGGTPMGAFGGVLEPEEIWDLVHFVQSLADNAENE